jgi:hypothetical protein
MPVHINQMSSSINVTDSQAFASPQIMEQILRMATEHMREEMARERRSEAERRLRQGVSSEDED